ncbi:MAG: universal stress protein [Acidimicrobiales bacterium]
MRKVLVAIDGSEATHRVVAFVNHFFQGNGGGGDVEVIGVNVGLADTVPPTGFIIPDGAMFGMAYPWYYDRPSGEWAEMAAREDDEARQEAAAVVAESGLEDAEALGRLGEPADTIVRVADEQDVDLIVVGDNHRGALQRLLAPSISREVVKRSERPVLVVP